MEDHPMDWSSMRSRASRNVAFNAFFNAWHCVAGTKPDPLSDEDETALYDQPEFKEMFENYNEDTPMGGIEHYWTIYYQCHRHRIEKSWSSKSPADLDLEAEKCADLQVAKQYFTVPPKRRVPYARDVDADELEWWWLEYATTHRNVHQAKAASLSLTPLEFEEAVAVSADEQVRAIWWSSRAQ